MFTITVTLLKVRCRDTESLTQSDRLAMAGAVFSDTPDAPGSSLPFTFTARINDGEERVIGTSSTITTSTPRVGVALQAFDIDVVDDWNTFNEVMTTIGEGVAVGLTAIGMTEAAKITTAVTAAISKVVAKVITLDKNDKLANYSQFLDLIPGSPGQPSVREHSIRFAQGDWTGYSDWDYSLDLRITCEPAPVLVPKPDPGIDAAKAFRHRATYAGANGFIGAFPNLHQAVYAGQAVGGTLLLRRNIADWRDVPISQLGSPDLDDFGLRMRATQDYANSNGYVGGFPNFFHADYGQGTVCGTILLGAAVAQWQDLAWSEIGGPDLADVGARFRGVNDWATAHGYAGGFPNMYHADTANGRVAGAVLLKPGTAVWRDVPLGQDLRPAFKDHIDITDVVDKPVRVGGPKLKAPVDQNVQLNPTVHRRP